MTRVAVVGAGVVGAAIARELSACGVAVALVDAADDVGEGTSKANTAILHTGFDAPVGSVEADLVRRGYRLLGDYAAAAGIAVERTGALLVAWDADQLAALPALAEKAVANGYSDTRRVDAAELYRLEPSLGAGALGAMQVPGESVVDPWSPGLAFTLEAVRDGAELLLGRTVTGCVPDGDGLRLLSSSGDVVCDWVVNAAGLGAGTIDVALGHRDLELRPRRGELVVFDKAARQLVQHILLPVPTVRGKGVLVSPTVFGNVLLGPTADDVDDSGDTATTAAGLASLRTHGQRILPALLDEDVTAVYAGVRAATDQPDYRIAIHPEQRYVRVAGIRSTGLTASMAIAEHVVELLRDAGCSVGPRHDSTPPPMPALGERQERPYQRADLVAADRAYGEVVCLCERVTAGELRDALGGPVPARTLDGLRRRTRALNGRCQGFHCGASVRAAFDATAAQVRP